MNLKNAKHRLMSLFTPGVVFDDSNPDAIMPTRGSKWSVGYDLYSPRRIVITPHRHVMVDIRLKAQFNPGWGGFVWDRSSYGSRGCHRFAGVMDGDYPGYWGIILYNSSYERLIIEKGDRIAQVIFQRCWTGNPKRGVVGQITDRTGGIGSTGK